MSLTLVEENCKHVGCDCSGKCWEESGTIVPFICW